MDAPITALWTGLLGILLIVLSLRVVRARQTENIIFGDAGNANLLKHIRVQANFVEYVPMGLLLLLVLELNGAGSTLLHGLGAALFVARLLHAFGLASTTGTSVGRFVGTVVTWLVVLGASALALWTFLSPGPPAV